MITGLLYCYAGGAVTLVVLTLVAKKLGHRVHTLAAVTFILLWPYALPVTVARALAERRR